MELYLAMEMVLYRQPVSMGEQDVLWLLGLYEQVVPTSGSRSAVLKHVWE